MIFGDIVLDGLESVFSDMSDPFKGLDSAYLQDKFIYEELGCIVSLYMHVDVMHVMSCQFTCYKMVGLSHVTP